MQVDRTTQSPHYSDRQLTAQMFAEFFETVQKAVHVPKLIAGYWEPKLVQKPQCPINQGFLYQANLASIDHVQCDSYGYRKAVCKLEVTQLLEFMSRPVAEIKWTCLVELERISAFRDVLEVELC